MSNELKETCYWWINKGKNRQGCGALSTLQCEKNGRCSFHETTYEVWDRMEKLELIKEKQSKNT